MTSTVNLKALIGRLDKTCKTNLEDAARLCVNRKNYEVGVEHYLHCLADDPQSDFRPIFSHFDRDLGRFTRAVEAELETLPTGNTRRPTFSPALTRWLERAWTVASLNLGLAEVRAGVLLLALLEKPGAFGEGQWLDLLESIPLHQLQIQLLDIIASSAEKQRRDLASEAQAAAQGAGMSPEQAQALAGGMRAAPVDGSALGRYAMNFTQRAREDGIDPVFGRDREIRQMVDILARRRKNNPIIVGEAGVGKTALVEGLAVRVVAGDVPDVLRNVEIIGLDMGLLQAGAGVKGEFENRLRQVIDEVKSSPVPIILFIDEAHTLIGAGNKAGGSDAANLLKPALARGELRTVAATTWSEYKKYFEKDAALSRRFQLVKVDEPDVATTATMLRGLRTRYEKAHNVIIRDDAIVAAAELGSRYINGRQHPDKGIDLVDTAAARVRVALTARPAELEDAERLIETLDREREVLVRDAEACAIDPGERLAELEAEIAETTAEVERLRGLWEGEKAVADRVIALRRELRESEKWHAEQAAQAEAAAKAAEKAAAEGKVAPDGKGATDGKGAKAADAKDGKAATAGKVSDGKGATDGKSASDGTEAEAEPPPRAPDEIRAELHAALGELRGLQGKDPLLHVEVTPEVIGRVVSDWTGIPLGKMVRDQAAALLALEAELQKRIKGQDHALEAIATRIRAAKAGLKNPKTPMGVFLFAGPSGVGKTETALGVADLLFGGERFLTTINMSEFQEKHTVSRLIGSPPGYVGYGEGGVLTEAVRQRPYSVVLLDEVEKAHPEVLNLFYQVFDKGMLADGEGRVIDFKDTVIFLTSNLASDLIMKFCDDESSWPSAETLTGKIRPTLSSYFKPALLGRMTVVPFYPIRSSVMAQIVELKLSQVVDRLMESHKMTLVVDPAVVKAIADRCTEVESGARNIDHIINSTLLPQVSTRILEQMATGDLPHSLRVGLDERGRFAYAFGDRERAPAVPELIADVPSDGSGGSGGSDASGDSGGSGA